jgi:hypothetical protein
MTNAIKVLLQIQNGFLQLESTLEDLHVSIIFHTVVFYFANIKIKDATIISVPLGQIPTTIRKRAQLLNVVSIAVVGILNIYCKNRWTVFYLELPCI